MTRITAELVAFALKEKYPEKTQRDLGDMLGVRERTFQRWAAGDGKGGLRWEPGINALADLGLLNLEALSMVQTRLAAALAALATDRTNQVETPEHLPQRQASAGSSE